jgi:hypothetical protein
MSKPVFQGAKRLASTAMFGRSNSLSINTGTANSTLYASPSSSSFPPKPSYSLRLGWPKSRNSSSLIRHQLWKPSHSTARLAITMGRIILTINLRGDGASTRSKDVEPRHKPARCLFRGSSMARQKLEATTWARNPDSPRWRHPLDLLSTFK